MLDDLRCAQRQALKGCPTAREDLAMAAASSARIDRAAVELGQAKIAIEAQARNQSFPAWMDRSHRAWSLLDDQLAAGGAGDERLAADTSS